MGFDHSCQRHRSTRALESDESSSPVCEKKKVKQSKDEKEKHTKICKRWKSSLQSWSWSKSESSDEEQTWKGKYKEKDKKHKVKIKKAKDKK